ncbi:hypothetical protein Salat_1317600 [Sesamum alatum]|uniref:Transmembrane protein n=1 Tax=Sesamum alatum TaxID=300844 RepID=A0AAE1YH74_9LAMI|nr:hypothetical protein Salat_1317600 [Sesamum alatum]
MVRPISMIHVGVGESFSPIPLAIGLFVSVSLLVGLCAKHARQVPRKTSDHPNAAKSPLSSPKQLITTLSNKAMIPLVHAKKSSGQEPESGGVGRNEDESGLWQKAILMGERCQPPEFSGVIYYDYSGNRIPEMPKSPRATSMAPLKSFANPVHKNENSAY